MRITDLRFALRLSIRVNGVKCLYGRLPAEMEVSRPSGEMDIARIDNATLSGGASRSVTTSVSLSVEIEDSHDVTIESTLPMEM